MLFIGQNEVGRYNTNKENVQFIYRSNKIVFFFGY